MGRFKIFRFQGLNDPPFYKRELEEIRKKNENWAMDYAEQQCKNSGFSVRFSNLIKKKD